MPRIITRIVTSLLTLTIPTLATLIIPPPALAQVVQAQRAQAIELNNVGEQLRQRGQYSEALAKYQAALKIVRQIGERQGEGIILSNVGLVYQKLGQYAKARYYLQQALAIHHAVGNRPGQGVTLSNLGLVSQAQGQYAEALHYFQQALVIRRDVGDRAGAGTTLTNLGLLYQAQGDYAKARHYLQQALATHHAVGNRPGQGTTLNNLGLVSQAQGRYTQARAYFQQALVIRREVGDRAGAGTTLNNLGLVSQAQGQYAEARNYFQQALAIHRTVGDRPKEGATLNNLGTMYEAQGQYAEALDYFQQALAIHRAVGDRLEEGTTLNNLGLVYQAQGQYPQALAHLQQALAIQREVGNRARESTILTNLGSVHDAKAQYAQARHYYQQALVIQRAVGARSEEGTTLHNLGAMYAAKGHYAKALHYYQQALAIRRAVGDPAGAGTTLHNMGLVYAKQAQYPQAETVLFQALSVLEALRENIPDASKVALFEIQKVTYRLLQETLVAQAKVVPALEVAERGRARAFLFLLARQFAGTDQPMALPRLAELQQIAQTQNATLVQYSVWENRTLYIWVLAPTGRLTFRSVALQPLQAKPQTLAQLVRAARCPAHDVSCLTSALQRSEGFNLKAQEQQSTPIAASSGQPYLRQLHELLIAPIADQLPTDPNQRVIFIPQDALFLIPFPALIDAEGTYLIEKHTILTAPSIQVLAQTRRRKAQLPATGEALIVGNPVMPNATLRPLPGAEREAQSVGQFLNTPVLLGRQATERTVKQRLEQAHLIHLATHGLLDDRDARNSALALTPGSGEDGFLTAAELFQMDLKADLVVLSACDTGKGRITGDGVIGLSRSLIAAGVPSVIVSLWAIPDAPTAELMVEFYRQRQNGLDKAQALRQAMLVTKEKHPHPNNWAAFTLIGEAE